MSRGYETATIICRDLGLDAGIRYAWKIAQFHGPLAAEYAEAAVLLELWQRDDYPSDANR